MLLSEARDFQHSKRHSPFSLLKDIAWGVHSMGRGALVAVVVPTRAAVHGVRRVGAGVMYGSMAMATAPCKLLTRGSSSSVEVRSLNDSRVAPSRTTPVSASAQNGGAPGAVDPAAPVSSTQASKKKFSKVKSDIVLSSGFLAFAQHSGFLQAIEEAGVPVNGVMGTSAGALSGSLYCAGYTPREVAAELSRVPPINLLRVGSIVPWRGGFLSLQGVIDRLREVLPPTFEELDREFACGVVDSKGVHRIIDSGALPEAVAASAAIPFLFEHVHIPGQKDGPFKDGGKVDRIGLSAWRDRRRAQLGVPKLMPRADSEGDNQNGDAPVDPSQAALPRALVHIIGKSSPFSGFDNASQTGEPNIVVVKSPKSGVSLLHLGDFEEAFNASLERARPYFGVTGRK